MEEMKGKKIGVKEGKYGDMMIRIDIGKEGMKMDDVKVIKMEKYKVV